MAASSAEHLLSVLPGCSPAVWDPQELGALGCPDPSCQPDPSADRTTYTLTFSKYNPTPGTGRTGFEAIPPNNYPFYNEKEKYTPVVQADGGQLSEWEPMYAPSREQAEEDRAKAYASGVPHGYVAPGSEPQGKDSADSMDIWVVSELHTPDEYGTTVDPATGRHSGGPFLLRVRGSMRVEELRLAIRDQGGILPALQRLSFAGKHLDASQRTLDHYGVTYWHKRFPHWSIKVRAR